MEIALKNPDNFVNAHKGLPIYLYLLNLDFFYVICTLPVDVHGKKYHK